jgi:tetratricopeptide (TPR) repeat protein
MACPPFFLKDRTMSKNGTERAAPAPEPPDDLGDRAHKDQERKRRLRFAGMVALVIVLGGFLLFFDNILGFFTSGKPKGPGLLDRRGAQLSHLSDTERRRILDEIRASIEKDRIDEARLEVLNLLQRDSSPEAHFLAGTVYLRQGNIKGAYDHFKEATRLRSDYTEAHSKLGEIYVMVGDYKIRNLCGNPVEPAARFSQRWPVAGIGNRPRAGEPESGRTKSEEAFAKATIPVSPKQIVYMADIHLRQGDRKKSEAWIRKIDQTRLDAEGYLCLAKYYLAAADEGKAVAYFEEALRRYPANPEVQYTYGQYLHSRRKFAEAAGYFQKAQAALPNVQVISYHLGQSLLAAGEREKTRALIDAMIARDPANILAWRLKTQYHLAQGERQAAMATLNHLIRYIPDSAASYALLAELNLQEGVLSLAERNARKAIGLGDPSISPHLVLGDCLFRKGRYEQAIESYGKALAIQPSNLTALLQTGDALLNLGQMWKAEATYRKAIEAYPNLGIIRPRSPVSKPPRGIAPPPLRWPGNIMKRTPRKTAQ